jgi:uncharacterized Rossmann fold enzyme
VNVTPLRIEGRTNTTADVTAENLEATFTRGYTPLAAAKEPRSKPVSIVGAGPSLAWTYKDLVGDVFACNSAHDFLLGKGIIPAYTMIWDAHPIMHGMIERPHKDVKYLIASRCHPSVFEKLKDYDVTVWHALGSEQVDKMLMKHQKVEPMIAGGCASVTRAMYVAATIGYTKEQHLFGVDSSHSEGKSHVAAVHSTTNEIQLRVCGKWFTVSPWMALQANDFKIIAPMMQGNGVRIVVHGTGLIPFVATFLGIETADIKVGVFEKHIERPLHQLRALFDVIRSTPLHGGSYVGI